MDNQNPKVARGIEAIQLARSELKLIRDRAQINIERMDLALQMLAEPTPKEVSDLARVFSKILSRYVGTATLSQINIMNREEANASLCHSHDYCDANQLMLDAWILLFNKDVDMDNVDETRLMERAWTYARENLFFALWRPEDVLKGVKLLGTEPTPDDGIPENGLGEPIEEARDSTAKDNPYGVSGDEDEPHDHAFNAADRDDRYGSRAL